MQTVLIVTEDPDVARRLTEVIAGWPCDVAIATDAHRARHLMEVLAFDAILVDAGEGGGQGAAIATELRRAAGSRARPRMVALLRLPTDRAPRGFDGQVDLGATEAELAHVLLGGLPPLADTSAPADLPA
jgi:CheY-like chemotaxis protein